MADEQQQPAKMEKMMRGTRPHHQTHERTRQAGCSGAENGNSRGKIAGKYRRRTLVRVLATSGEASDTSDSEKKEAEVRHPEGVRWEHQQRRQRPN